MRSGDGFVTCGDGQTRWGRFGAAGVLVRCVEGDDHWFFLARRSEYTHRGGSWAIPGGALDDGEAPLDGALREFAEEIGVPLPDHVVAHVHESDHGGWSYWTVVVDVTSGSPCRPSSTGRRPTPAGCAATNSPSSSSSTPSQQRWPSSASHVD